MIAMSAAESPFCGLGGGGGGGGLDIGKMRRAFIRKKLVIP